MSDSTDRNANTSDPGSNGGESEKQLMQQKKTIAKVPSENKRLAQKETGIVPKRSEKKTLSKKRTGSRKQQIVNNFNRCEIVAGDCHLETQVDIDDTASSDNLETESSEDGSETELSDASESGKKEHARQDRLSEDNEVQSPYNILQKSSNPAESENQYQGFESADKPSTSIAVKNDSDINTAESSGTGINRNIEDEAKQENQMANKSSDGAKCHVSKENKMATKIRIAGTAKKIKRRKKTPLKSSLKEFEEYAKLDLVKRRYHKSTKPHLLLQTVEFEVNHGQQSKSEAALRKALKQWQTHSRPSSEELKELAEQCTNSNSLLRAVLFHVITAVKMKAERKENEEYCFLLSEHITEVCCLLQKMSYAEERNDMDNGVHYKQVVKFVPPLMSRIYDLGCDEADAKCKADALSWIAFAHSHIEDYKNAFEFGEKGRRILDKEFPQIEDRHKEQAYSRLLECVGLGYEKWKRQFPEALEIFEESVVATRCYVVANDDDESKRETSLSIRIGYVQSVQKKITSQCKTK